MNSEDLSQISNDDLASLAMTLIERCEPAGVFLSTPLDEDDKAIDEIAQLSKIQAVGMALQVVGLLRLRLQVEETAIAGSWQSQDEDGWVYELVAS